MNRKFDDPFKVMAVELSVVKGSVAKVAKELEIDPVYLVSGAGIHVTTAIRFFRTTRR